MTACNSPSDELAEDGQSDASLALRASSEVKFTSAANGEFLRRTPPPQQEWQVERTACS